MDRDRRYSSEEVGQIVREALELERSEGPRTLSYADLEDVARQCGVGPETLERALEHRALEHRKQALRDEWRKKAVPRLSLPLIVCAGLVVLNVASGGFPWSVFPIVFWLVPEALRARSRLFPDDERLVRELEERAGRDGAN